MVDASILIPTFRHAELLPHALASALDQEGASVEVLVVGDGVEEATREVVARYADDPRVRFFDFPKGQRHGEAYRHEALGEARGGIVCYLSDDDLLLPDHAERSLRLLADADFLQPPSVRLLPSGELQFFPWNYARTDFREIGRVRRASIGLTGVAHTLDAYRRLPHGWRTTPSGLPTDHYMWLQWLDLPGLRVVYDERLSYLTFPDPYWKELPAADRAETLADWFRRTRAPGFRDEHDRMLERAIRAAAEEYHLWAWREQKAVETLRSTRTWRLRERLVQARSLGRR